MTDNDRGAHRPPSSRPAPGEDVIVGMSDLRVRSGVGALVSYGLGSSVAVCLHDPSNRVGGLLNFVLPDSATDSTTSERKPAVFADSGIGALSDQMMQAGADGRELSAKIVGGASLSSGLAGFSVAERNIQAARRQLQRRRIPIVAEDVGRSIGRTVRFDVSSGELLVSSPGLVDRRL